MIFKNIRSYAGKFSSNLSLQTVLILPLIVQIFTAVGLTGYLSFINSRKAVNDLAMQLSDETINRIQQHVSSHLRESHVIHEAIASSIDSGTVNFNEKRS